MKATNMRDLLLRLGISNFNATMIIQSTFVNPATTDPKMPPIVMLIAQLQSALAGCGADVQVNGRIDDATNAACEALLPGWIFQPWSKIVGAVVAFHEAGGRFVHGVPQSSAMSLSGMPLGLPDVPGGVLTYAVGAFVAYKLWKRR